jgi:hypothetical protein
MSDNGSCKHCDNPLRYDHDPQVEVSIGVRRPQVSSIWNLGSHQPYDSYLR